MNKKDICFIRSLLLFTYAACFRQILENGMSIAVSGFEQDTDVLKSKVTIKEQDTEALTDCRKVCAAKYTAYGSGLQQRCEVYT